MLFLDEDSGNVTFSSDKMGILSIDLNNINFNDVNLNKHPNHPSSVIQHLTYNIND